MFRGVFVSLLLLFLSREVSSDSFVPMIVVFGDSFVDSGNNNHLNTTARANHLPYGINFDGRQPTGRWSDGHIVTDYLATYMNAEYPPAYLDYVNITQGANFGSAGSGIMNETHIGGQVLTFTDQVNGFVQYRSLLDVVLGHRLAYYLTTRSIFYLNIGNNDVNNYVHNNSTTLPLSFRTALLDQMQQKLETLYSLGARRVIVSSMYALGCAPMYQTQGQCDPFAVQAAQVYNQGLLQLISDMESSHDGLHIVYTNAYEVMLEVHANPQTYGMNNVSYPCCPTDSVTRWCNATDSYCSTPETYLFWDVAHPTDAFNRIAASLFWNGSEPYALPMNVRSLVIDY